MLQTEMAVTCFTVKFNILQLEADCSKAWRRGSQIHGREEATRSLTEDGWKKGHVKNTEFRQVMPYVHVILLRIN